MKVLSLFLLFGFSFISTFLSCQLEAKNEKMNDVYQLYVNEYGEIRLTEEKGNIIRTVFKNNHGDIFDTTMFINNNLKLIPKKDSLPFLQFRNGGIELRKECVIVHEFSSIAYLNRFIKIRHLYTRPFYKIGKKVTIKGDILHSKGGTTINGIYLKNKHKSIEAYKAVKGIIKKEKYPIEYYSTDESPQGMFADTNEVHYRLIMEEYEITEIPKQKFKGTTNNINGQAAFIYEFSDSEVFYLDNKLPWNESELNIEIELKAVLVQFIDGKSVLKNWEIIH